MKERGKKNGLIDLKILNQKNIIEIGFKAKRCRSSFYVPESGIIDYKQVTNKLSELITFINPNSKILTSCKVLDVKKDYLITTKAQSTHIIQYFVEVYFLIDLKKDNMKLDMKIVGFRGDYYYLNSQSKYKVKHLIYPVPNPEFPFLGVHLTRMTDGKH